MTGRCKTTALANTELGTGSECSFTPCKPRFLADSRLVLAALATFFSSLFMGFFRPIRTAQSGAGIRRVAPCRCLRAIRCPAGAARHIVAQPAEVVIAGDAAFARAVRCSAGGQWHAGHGLGVNQAARVEMQI